MAAFGVRRNDLQPDVINSNSIISACEKGERGQDAPGLIVGLVRRVTMAALEVRRNDLRPDVFSSNSVIRACGKGGQRQHSRCDAMTDVISSNSVISACGESGRWQRAPEFIAGEATQEFAAQCRQLQCGYQRLREGWAMAERTRL